MADIETEQVKAEAAQLGALATAVSTDVRKRSDVEALLAVAQSCAMNGSVDVAFFNAGVLGAGVSVVPMHFGRRDLPLQLATALFEIGGGAGLLLKPPQLGDGVSGGLDKARQRAAV